MAKKEIAKGTMDISPNAPVLPDREGRWQAFLERYEKENPVRFARCKARGEFDKIPASFR